MNRNNLKQITLSLVTVMVLTACGGGSTTSDDTTESTTQSIIALDSIKAYAQNSSNDVPTVQTYIDAGVQGVTSDNLADLNSLVESLEAEDVDTPEELNALTASLGVNIAPVANAQNITLDEDSSKAITLTATDAEGDALTYMIVTQPTHGTLSGTAPNLTYTPTADYYGDDSFSFKVNDGKADSAVVDVTLHITDVAEPNNVPVAHAQTVTLAEDSTKAITLTADDANGDILTYTLVSQPTHGTLSGTAPNMTYTPTANYFGVDSFSYKANDGKVDSETVAVGLTITSVNDAPIVSAGLDLSVEVNKGIRLTAIGSDVEGAVGYVWKKGNVVLARIPVFDYVPTTVGTETLTVTVMDSEGETATDSMLLTVTSKPNTAPIANAQTITLDEDTSKAITLTATDADNDTLTYTLVTQSVHGTLSGTAPNLTYTPTADYFGADRFTFKVNDGKADSAIVTVSITVKDVAEPQRPFITTWKTDNEGVTDDNQIKIGTRAESGTYNYNIDCDGDGTYEATGVTGDYICTYDTAGTYTVEISGEFPHFWMGDWTDREYDRKKLISINQWGDIEWKSMKNSFYSCQNMFGNFIDIPNLSSVNDMSGMFIATNDVDFSIADWNTSNVTNMSETFGLSRFNNSLESWDVSNVINMSGMFARARNFNQDIGNWNVSNVVDMCFMFAEAESFNQDIGDWNVSNVTNMSGMFRQLDGVFSSFNQDIGDWDVSNVTNMSSMFNGTNFFNQDIKNWDTSNVKDMSYMFSYAQSFNQGIGNWNVSNVRTMARMFEHTPFNQNIGDWNVSNVTDMSLMWDCSRFCVNIV